MEYVTGSVSRGVIQEKKGLQKCIYGKSFREKASKGNRVCYKTTTKVKSSRRGQLSGDCGCGCNLNAVSCETLLSGDIL